MLTNATFDFNLRTASATNRGKRRLYPQENNCNLFLIIDELRPKLAVVMTSVTRAMQKFRRYFRK